MNSYFRTKIQDAINEMENGSDTPDFILAQYLCACLAAFDEALARREQWYGRPIGRGKAIDGQAGPLKPGDPVSSESAP